jgi:phospholipid transport system substrate-binding protein
VKSTKLLVIASLVLAGALGSGAAWAGPATDVVRAKQTVLFSIVAKKESAERQQKLKELFDEMLDYGALARESLGDKWGTLDAGQQKEFRDRLEKLVRRNYQRNLAKMLGWTIEYVGEKAGTSGVLVKTQAVSKTDKRAEPILLDFRMRNVEGKWLVVDIIPENASLVDTYKQQFTRILEKDGYPALKAKMDKKLEEPLD